LKIVLLPLLHGSCGVVVTVDVVAGDAVAINEWGLDDLGTGDHYGLLDIDRLLNDYRGRSHICRAGDRGGGR
jgi:hypothetical protein